MLNTRLSVVRTVRTAFLAAERDQNAAALSAARCMVAMLEGCQQARLPVGTAGAEIALIAKSAALAVEARQCLIDAHAGMAQLPKQIGIPERSWGDTDECPPDIWSPNATDQHLRVVG